MECKYTVKGNMFKYLSYTLDGNALFICMLAAAALLYMNNIKNDRINLGNSNPLNELFFGERGRVI